MRSGLGGHRWRARGGMATAATSLTRSKCAGQVPDCLLQVHPSVPLVLVLLSWGHDCTASLPHKTCRGSRVQGGRAAAALLGGRWGTARRAHTVFMAVGLRISARMRLRAPQQRETCGVLGMLGTNRSAPVAPKAPAGPCPGLFGRSSGEQGGRNHEAADCQPHAGHSRRCANRGQGAAGPREGSSR